MSRLCLSPLALTVAIACSPALAQAGSSHSGPSTKLHHCGEQTCLLITGQRDDRTSAVIIENHEVAVSGGKRWHASLPLQTVRNWAAPGARAIAVEVAGAERKKMQARLPIGVFGNTTKLAFLSVTAP